MSDYKKISEIYIAHKNINKSNNNLVFDKWKYYSIKEYFLQEKLETDLDGLFELEQEVLNIINNVENIKSMEFDRLLHNNLFYYLYGYPDQNTELYYKNYRIMVSIPITIEKLSRKYFLEFYIYINLLDKQTNPVYKKGSLNIFYYDNTILKKKFQYLKWK